MLVLASIGLWGFLGHLGGRISAAAAKHSKRQRRRHRKKSRRQHESSRRQQRAAGANTAPAHRATRAQAAARNQRGSFRFISDITSYLRCSLSKSREKSVDCGCHSPMTTVRIDAQEGKCLLDACFDLKGSFDTYFVHCFNVSEK